MMHEGHDKIAEEDYMKIISECNKKYQRGDLHVTRVVRGVGDISDT